MTECIPQHKKKRREQPFRRREDASGCSKEKSNDGGLRTKDVWSSAGTEAKRSGTPVPSLTLKLTLEGFNLAKPPKPRLLSTRSITTSQQHPDNSYVPGLCPADVHITHLSYHHNSSPGPRKPSILRPLLSQFARVSSGDHRVTNRHLVNLRVEGIERKLGKRKVLENQKV